MNETEAFANTVKDLVITFTTWLVGVIRVLAGFLLTALLFVLGAILLECMDFTKTRLLHRIGLKKCTPKGICLYVKEKIKSLNRLMKR